MVSSPTFNGPRSGDSMWQRHSPCRPPDRASTCALESIPARSKNATRNLPASRSTSQPAATRHTGDVLVTRNVVDLVAGSGASSEDRGDHNLKGIPEPWRLVFFAT